MKDMDNDNVLDMRHLIKLADDDSEQSADWKDYSESSVTFEQRMEEYYDGPTRRRLRRAMERKLKKKTSKKH